MKVLVLDGVAEEGLVPFREEPGLEIDIKKKLTEDELVEIIPQYHAMIVRSATKVTPRVLDHANNMIVVGRAGVGVDNIDLAAATNKGVLVVNAPDGNTIAAAELTMAMILGLSRSVPQANATLRSGKWDKKAFMGVELRGRTLGVLGMGRIGSNVAKRALAMEMNIVAYDPYINEEAAAKMGVKVLPLEDVLKQADFLTIHMPKTKESYHLINEKTIAVMKDGVRIINCARGGIIDEEALYNAIKSGKVAGAALDVFEKEPNTESPLYEFNNVIMTPHLGASTEEAQLNVAVDVAKEIVAALKGEVVKNTVNIPSLDAKTMAAVKPYLDLAGRLGNFHAQMITGRVNKIELIYSGELSALEVTPITTAFLKGMLDPILQENVNFVNASVIAKNRGIEVIQTTAEMAKDYNNLMTAKVYCESGERVLAATLLQGNVAHLVNIDGYRVDVVPSGHMLVVPHYDRPKIIGKVGTLIGEHDINIAAMQVGRKEIGGKAVMVLTIDDVVPDDTLRAIAQVDGILDVKFVSL
ncbi:D-3-phosphoglycerate dehydrogenase [Desulfofarcimen acetoxidans DSM 771]|jgi:D-3-phosphoglycerate dehydrogenase|uniref:D-3-phosphoglycerate dehydrogenase n=1 Tax=Desulfofarcimen acetoxidans (strain ATCC 49208 / DSM 771 / KCTC 5769 / VKM B-1644 / 5575) TaxID=485916 RepID=C8W035_DESAS|nr:phosphoglycerate dehydrogenase [Desulfofarcimen acetoxidans]ACV65003.1 D-3-phosphoglycerate dehydrogenase [Desulfofarcimen acetoxidans DSM 771]